MMINYEIINKLITCELIDENEKNRNSLQSYIK